MVRAPWFVSHEPSDSPTGARFDDFHRLFVFIYTAPIYQNRAWVIADGDNAGRDNINRLKETYTTWSSDSFTNFKKENLEDYYADRFQEKVKEIFLIQDKRKRREPKKVLTKEVALWIKNNFDEAKSAFEISSAEVIMLLKNIRNKIFENDSLEIIYQTK